MTRRHRVLWGEGVFLRPQHFQQQELFLEDRMARVLRATSAHPWGTGLLEVDREALATGRFAVQRLEATFQDGTFFSAPGQDPPPPARCLEDLPGAGVETLAHACLPLLNGFGGNADAGDAPGPLLARYRTERVVLPDLHTEALESEVTVLRPQARILFEAENRDGLLSLPLARLVKDGSGRWALDEGFVAPCTCLRGAPPLPALLRRIQDILTVRSGALAEAQRERARGVAEFGTADIAGFWLLHTVNRSHPVLGHLLAFPGAHPEEAYRALAQLAGELLTFSTSRTLEEIPPYRHLDLTSTFRRLETLLRELLETVVSDRCVRIPLAEARPSFHTGRLEGEGLAQGCDLYLSVSGPRTAADILESVPLRLKVGSPDDVERQVNAALPGVALVPAARTPAALPVRAGNHYFLLEPGGPVHQRMVQARCVCIYVPEPLRGLELELLAVRR